MSRRLPAALAATALLALPATAQERFEATALEVERFTGELTVEIHEGPGIEAAVTASDPDYRPTIEVANGVLRVVGPEPRPAEGGLFGLFRDEPDYEVALRVPQGTPVTLDGFNGTARIGDIEAALDLRAVGSAEVDVGDVRTARLHCTGSCDVELDDVDERLEIEISGSGDVEVDDADVATMTIAISGSGDVRVEEGRIGDLDIRVSGSGDARIGGRAARGEFRVSGSGSIQVDRVEDVRTFETTGTGSIRIGS